MSTLRSILLGALALQYAFYCESAHASDAPSEGVEFFEKRIRPILVTHCYECHNAQTKKLKGGLGLDTRESMLKGGDNGPALVPGDPDKSLFIRAVRHTDRDLRMPPKVKLTDAQVADLAAWVKMGAPDPRKAGTVIAKQETSIEERRRFWSFQPVKDPPLPKVREASWVKTPVDHFILARLENAGVIPAPVADKRTLLRRVTFDLTGMPPTPEEMAAFLADGSPQAFERIVDRLLASPRYGERWGRHWLDVVRYADTCGNASDYPVPQAHLYRDWVIRAFNRDMPYDQFLRDQIAGDLIASRDDERMERIIATGYLAIARRFGGDRMGEHHLTIEDTIDNLGRAVLGVTIACARCHDHKFDPFTMSDYYGLYGVFSSTRYPFPGAEVGRAQQDFVPLLPPEKIESMLKPHRDKLLGTEAKIKALEAEEANAKKAPDGPEKISRLVAAAKAVADARKEKAAIQENSPILPTAYAVAEGKPANAKVHLRGDPKRLGEEVPRHFPVVLGGNEVPKEETSSGRLQLAEWVTNAKNPLTARVMVNRIWLHHFGRGLVQTPNDFGRQGKAPSHPELLDFLASRFIESGWSIKAMHKLILLSKTWQLASQDVPDSLKRDPSNELFWRFNRRRLDAESIRDAMLFVSGTLEEHSTTSHPFPPPKTWGFTQHAPFVAVYETRQRSIYLMQQRLRKHPYLALFDGADPSSSTGARLPSTTPLQALFLMNDPLAHEVAAKFAGRLTASSPDESSRLALAYQLAYSRLPTKEEQQECIEFLDRYRDKLAALKTPVGEVQMRTWAAFSRALLGANEFIFVD